MRNNRLLLDFFLEKILLNPLIYNAMAAHGLFGTLFFVYIGWVYLNASLLRAPLCGVNNCIHREEILCGVFYSCFRKALYSILMW